MKTQSTPMPCVAFIGGAILILVGTIILASFKGQAIYDTGYFFGLFVWLVLIAGYSFISFIGFLVLTVIGLFKRKSRKIVGWHVFCVFLAVALPFAMILTATETERLSRSVLFRRVGVDALRRDTTLLTQNYEPRAEALDRYGHKQHITGEKLPESFRKLGLKEVYVADTAVIVMTGGFGGVKSGYTFFPLGNNASMPDAEKIAEGIYHHVTSE